ncbi:MAG TPA: DUF4450 domain-containing protein [Puia sp.]|jgi:hypothetical protein
MKQVVCYIVSFFLLMTYARGQRPGLWHGKRRVLRYHPEGTDFVIVNGSRRFNRALYGTNTAFRVEAGDLPEFAMYMPGMGGTFRLGLLRGEKSRWLINADSIRARYRPGSMIYEIKDSLLGTGKLFVTVLALADGEGFVLKVKTADVDPRVRLVCAYGGATGKKFSRDGDIGADPESSFYLDPEYCKDDHFVIEGNRFLLKYGAGKEINGVFPVGTKLKVVDAGKQDLPESFLGGEVGATPALGAELAMGEDLYFLVKGGGKGVGGADNIEKGGDGAVPDYTALAVEFEKAEAARKKLTERVIVHTPDPFINTLGGALGIAADGIWEDPSYLHGAVAWRQRLPAWRGPYVADPLGWHDRARKHFSSYALSQVTTPADGPVVADTALHLARQLEKMGTSLFSSGYICRSPGGDIRPHHYDMNLVFIDQLLDHFCWTGDTAYVREMWPVIKRHLAWEKRNFDSDNDGLYDAYCCIWASDALEYSGGGVTHSSAYNYRANLMASELAALIGEDGRPYREEASKILKAINARLWMPGKGSYAEYIDWGTGLLHPSAGLWTIYHAIDSRVCDAFQAWQSLYYIDTDIPHIPIRAAGLEDTTLFTLSTTNWQPYTWSINNVVLAESLHTALAYWQGGRADAAWPLWKGALVESMYLGASPGNFQQLSFYDAMRGELYRDFGDPIGMAARSLVEGLFGIRPDALHDTLTIQPGWPLQWGAASLHVPDIDVDYKRVDRSDTYKIVSRFGKPMNLVLRLRARSPLVKGITVNGQRVVWHSDDGAIGTAMLEVVAPASVTGKYEIVVRWGDDAAVKELKDTMRAVPASRVGFVRCKQGSFAWWKPVFFSGKDGVSFGGSVQGVGGSGLRETDRVKGGRYDTINLTSYFNDVVTNIFKNQYRSPRPASPTLQLPVQGIGNWCYPLVTANIDDAGLRRIAGGNGIGEGTMRGEMMLPSGVPLATPSGEAARNVVFTSRWDNYPDSVVVPVSGNAAHAWFLLAGSTNPMQSHITNGVIVVRYKDGTEDKLELVNPTNWWPIEQDYYEDGFAFRTGAPRPMRVLLKTGVVMNGGDNVGMKDGVRRAEWSTIKGFSNTAIDGGAATVLDMALDKGKELDRVVLRTTASDVVVGLMSMTLLREIEK